MNQGRELVVAVAGLGFGRNHARVLTEMPGARLAAVCDPDPERLDAAASGREVSAYTDHREMLQREPLDAVIIAVPTRLHFTVAVDAIASGCAVMVEKPIAPSLAEAQHLVAAADAAGVALMHGHIERFNPAVRELVRRVQAGEAGRIIQMAARRLAYFVARPREVDIGVVHDLAFHEIDVMRLIAGCEVERVYAETQSGLRTPFEDAVNGTLRFQGAGGRPGIVGTLEVHWLSPRKVRELSVLGEEGEFAVDYQSQALEFRPAQSLHGQPARSSHEGPLLQIQGEEPGATVKIEVQHREPLREELAAFLEALRTGAAMPVSNQDALAAVAVADALTESGRSGRAVTLA